MRLALISDTYPPMRTSAAVQMSDLAAALRELGVQVTVLVPDHQATGQKLSASMEDGVSVIRFACPKAKDQSYPIRVAAEWVTPYLMRNALARNGLLKDSFDGVVWYSPSIFFGPLVNSLKSANQCSAYLILRDIFPQWALDMGILKPGPVFWILDKIAQAQYRKADVIGVQSPGNLTFLSEAVAPARRFEVLNNWVRSRPFSGEGINLRGTTLEGRKLLIYTGNMGVAQGAGVVLQLAEELQNRTDIGILMVGRGSEVSRLADAAASRKLDNLMFHPEVEPARMPDVLAQGVAGLVLLDPRHRSQNIPGKAVSYLSHGLPTLAVVDGHSDLAELIRSNKVGWVLDSERALGPDVAFFFDEIEADQKISERCRSLASRLFSPEAAARQILDGVRKG